MTSNEKYILRRGENIILPDGKTVLKASLMSSTRATYSLAARAYFFEGIMQTGEYKVGDYVSRETDGLTYMVETIQPEPPHNTLQKVYFAQCNTLVRIEIEKEEELDENGEPIGCQDKWAIKANNVKAYMDITPRSDKQMNDGRLDQGIYIIHIPHCYKIDKSDRITTITPSGKTLKKYRVESVNDSLIPLDGSDSGVDIAQLSEDLRPGDAVSPATDGNSSNNTPDVQYDENGDPITP